MPYYAPAASSSNSCEATVDFGFASGNEGDIAVVTVTGQTWVTADSIIIPTVLAAATDDHEAEEPVVEGLVPYVANLVPGVGFDIYVTAPRGTWGRYTVQAIGV